MRKPDFFIVGAQRSGTSSMKAYLQKHPDVFIPKTSHEPTYFATDCFRRCVEDEQTYLSLFADHKDEKRMGEKSVAYLFSRRAAFEIKAFQPSASIIIMLRNPVDMLLSWHHYCLFLGREELADFEAALAADRERERGLGLPEGVSPEFGRWFVYRERVKYAQHVRRYFEAFDRRKVHVIVFDDFVRDTAGVYRDTLQFLGVDPGFQTAFTKVNAAKRPRSRALARLLRTPPEPLLKGASRLVPFSVLHGVGRGLATLNSNFTPPAKIRPEFRRRLQADLLPEVKELSELLGRDLTHWCRPGG